MLEENARVIKVVNNRVTVETVARSSCSHCSVNNCSVSVIAGLFGLKRNRFELDQAFAVSKGQEVVIGVPDELLVKASLQAYFLPVLGMIGLIAVCASLGWHEWVQALAGFVGLLAGLYATNLIARGDRSKTGYEPVMLRAAAVNRVAVMFKPDTEKEALK